jgi:extracellular elastinolytic metalloproteinase
VLLPSALLSLSPVRISPFCKGYTVLKHFTEKIASKTPTVSVEKAIEVAEAALDGTYNKSPAKLEYLVKEDKTVVLTHVVEIQNEADFTWYEAFVDAHTGELVSVVDFVSDATVSIIVD